MNFEIKTSNESNSVVDSNKLIDRITINLLKAVEVNYNNFKIRFKVVVKENKVYDSNVIIFL